MEPSPPSSRKSSAISKIDLVENPRASPYHTRSRKNSNLTEENIAVHNDSPTTRSVTKRITRRMSQGSENAIVLTPMPQATRRTSRRSPSVVSGDDVCLTPKKKFSVAQENVVMEEDEAVEENKSHIATPRPPPIANGSTNVNKVDKENISTLIVNGSISEATAQPIPKSQTGVNEINLQTEKINKTAAAAPSASSSNLPTIISVSNAFNASPAVVSTAASGPIVSINNTVSSVTPAKISTPASKPAVSTPVSSKQSPNLSTVGSIKKLETAITVDKPVARIGAKAFTVDIVEKSTPRMSPTVAASRDSTSVSSKVEELSAPSVADPTEKEKLDISIDSSVDLDASVFDSNSPAKANNLSAIDIIVIPDTPTAPNAFKSVTSIPRTPLQVFSANEITVLETPPSILKSSVDVKATPKTPLQTKPSSASSAPILETPQSILRTSVNVTTTPKTPLQTGKSSAGDTTILDTPQSALKIFMDMTASPKTPLQTGKSPANETIIPETPQSASKTSTEGEKIPESPSTKNVSIVIPSIKAVTDSEEEILLRTPPTPAKSASKTSKASTGAPDPKKSDDGTPKSSKSTATPLTTAPSNTVPSRNGIDADEEYPKWGSSIRRKSDGQPIDKFGVDKEKIEVATLTVKRKSTKDMSIVSVQDSSDEDSGDEDSNEETKSRNEFLDDEAMESNGEASMDEEERKYLEEHEVPVDGISLGSDSDHEELSDENESNDSFVVSDSSIPLLDGVGDDLDFSAEFNTSQSKAKRGNKIFDTSDDEDLNAENKSRKSSTSKRRSETSLVNRAKYFRLVAGDNSDDEDELANVEDEPRKTRSSKRLSESKSLSKKEMKRLSLHPNTKLGSLKSHNEEQQSAVNEKNQTTVDVSSSEEDVKEILANLDAEPRKKIRSKRLSESTSSSKKDLRRLSLHPNTKLNTSEIEIAATISDDSNKEELENLDPQPKRNKDSRRQSESNNSISKKEMKRMSLHTNTKLSSMESNAEEEQQQSIIKDDVVVNDELANLDAEPKTAKNSKSLSDSMSISKKDAKRLSLHPNTKLNRSGVHQTPDEQSKLVTNDSIVNTSPLEKVDVSVEKMDVELTATTNTTQRNVQADNFRNDIQAHCDAFLQLANEAKLKEKLKNKVTQLQDDKYQRLKEKKTAKLQEKREKEARRLEREALAAKQRQLKREKKTKIVEVTEQEKAKAIEKALAFGEMILAKKNQHSSNVKEEPRTEAVKEKKPTTTPRKSNNRKRKMLQILSDGPSEKKKIKLTTDSEQISAKPEGFQINSLPTKNKKLKQVKPARIGTSAGSFEIGPVSAKKSKSPFTVTTLNYNPSTTKFSTFKDKAIFNSSVRRESADELLNRKRKQRKLKRN